MTKEFRVKPTQYNLYKVYVENGGEVPRELQTNFTSPREANEKIKVYLANRRDYPARGRIKKNAENKS